MKTLAEGVKVTDGALTQIVVRAAEAVDGARVRRPRRKVEVEIADGVARVELELAVAYGKVLPANLDVSVDNTTSDATLCHEDGFLIYKRNVDFSAPRVPSRAFGFSPPTAAGPPAPGR